MSDHPQDPHAIRSFEQHYPFASRVLTGAALVALVFGGIWLLWNAVDVLLLAFAGLLFGVLLYALSNKVEENTPLSYHWSLALVIGGIVLLIGLAGWFVGPRIASQSDQLSQQLPQLINTIEERLSSHAWGEWLLQRTPAPGNLLAGNTGLASSATGIASTIIDALSSVFFVIFVGLFLAVSPRMYQDGVVRLFPKNQRPRVREVLGTLGHTLGHFLLAQLISMTIVGLLTGLGLWLIGVPLALTLGLITALLEFVPLIGPIVAYVPGVLLAATLGFDKAMMALGVYLTIQLLESNVILPVVQFKVVHIPPVVLLVVQVIFGVLFGFLGIFVAAPLIAVLMVLVEMLYMEDVLHDSIKVPGEEEAQDRAQQRAATSRSEMAST